MEQDDLGIHEEIFKQIRAILIDDYERPADGGIPEGTRQILMVDNYRLITANFRDNETSNKLNSCSVVMLTGDPSPNSNKKLNKAYVSFVETQNKIRLPQFVEKHGAIYMWMYKADLPLVLSQIKENNICCWIGHFENGHIYADIHAAKQGKIFFSTISIDNLKK